MITMSQMWLTSCGNKKETILLLKDVRNGGIILVLLVVMEHA
jgi:hypothetical protein